MDRYFLHSASFEHLKAQLYVQESKQHILAVLISLTFLTLCDVFISNFTVVIKLPVVVSLTAHIVVNSTMTVNISKKRNVAQTVKTIIQPRSCCRNWIRENLFLLLNVLKTLLTLNLANLLNLETHL